MNGHYLMEGFSSSTTPLKRPWSSQPRRVERRSRYARPATRGASPRTRSRPGGPATASRPTSSTPEVAATQAFPALATRRPVIRPPDVQPIRPPPNTGPGITEGLKRPHGFRTDPRLHHRPALALPIRHRHPRRSQPWVTRPGHRAPGFTNRGALSPRNNDPRPAYRLVRGCLCTWRVMDSNQRRTTPTVLQGNVITTPELRLCDTRLLLPRAYPAPNRTPSAVVMDGWTPRQSPDQRDPADTWSMAGDHSACSVAVSSGAPVG
jgi:hypothetical protein